jgi:hypothetical protein
VYFLQLVIIHTSFLLPPGEEPPYAMNRELGVYRIGLYNVAKKKIPYPCRETNEVM